MVGWTGVWEVENTVSIVMDKSIEVLHNVASVHCIVRQDKMSKT